MAKYAKAKYVRTNPLQLDRGEYIIADPSYIISDLLNANMAQVLKQTNAKVYRQRNAKGLKLKDYTYVIFSDFGGDGTFDGTILTGKSEKNILIGVDSGMISLVPVAMVKEFGDAGSKTYPKIKFTEPAQIKIWKSQGRPKHVLAKGATVAFAVTDGRTALYVPFEEEEHA